MEQLHLTRRLWTLVHLTGRQAQWPWAYSHEELCGTCRSQQCYQNEHTLCLQHARKQAGHNLGAGRPAAKSQPRLQDSTTEGAHFGKPPSTASMLGTTSPNCFKRSLLRHSASDTAVRSSSASASSVSALKKVPWPAARPLACPDPPPHSLAQRGRRCCLVVRSSRQMS